MIRIDAMWWLAVEPVDMRAGVDRLLARVVQVFGAARAHHGYLFTNHKNQGPEGAEPRRTGPVGGANAGAHHRAEQTH